VISEQMKQRMSECGKIGAEITDSGVRRMEPPTIKPTSKRKEPAKIAGTSEE